jgi:hypothetical protein
MLSLASAMIVIFASCVDNVPNFAPPTASVCSPERQTVACGCSEYMRFDPVEGALFYRVERHEVASNTPWRVVGWLGCGGLRKLPKEGGKLWWFFAWDEPVPVYNSTYAYRITACNAIAGCSGPTYEILYTAAPYTNGLTLLNWE